ncbi:MAG TPA: GspE/PulE family protein [Candidatus Hydrogenedentes bacterium]|jgi:type II secretory ATPase GspE/PulE/Tfp pilus assembly ATPase PilB-like protein|nr:MAG: Type II secretion system protein E [Candidatus Hydrogenedentes bacterium ADurb.Bin170]HOD96305.1 GspE/PulE family protein [Candidatus Hydrogenedentota bacterium]HOM47312.1 GspE/PulE family protein [Candidatus Hydrogenedentota bacterium]HOR52015.1 GspE/PulE family protein [Candidatus Hydrogenedentota bacterium]HPK25741.1 GspE/PulE family protein [Candidatus Hydrogenedentota bacterium]
MSLDIAASAGTSTILPLHEIQTAVVNRLESRDEMGVTDAVDTILSQAVYHGSSDIHLEPWTECVSLRYRLDGILQQIAIIPQEFQPKLIARIKVLADLVVYRKDVPQDGRIDRDKTSAGRPMRVSAVPTVRGEKIVIRILGSSRDLYQLDILGFPERIVHGVQRIITRPQGTLLLTGPSSSGKSTTIYAALHEILHLQKHTINIVSIEDPVEFAMDRIAQIQVNPHADLTFTTALRSILRQDPEVIVVGEIRDFETAKMAIQAGLTGHLVISTIHSGTAAGVFTRLIDMGIEPFLVASSITGVLAQRLIRLNCPDCTEEYTPDPLMMHYFGLTAESGPFYKGAGCKECQNIGYRSRAGIGEFLEVDNTLAEQLLRHPTTSQIHEIAVSKGMIPLAKDGLDKARLGITTIEELYRVLPELS